MSHDSVSQWLTRLKDGDRTAVTPLWNRYYPKLVAAARARLANGPRQAADEEDVALCAFDSFCRDAAAGRLPRLDDRDDLWRVLLLIAGQKAVDLIRYETAAKRGGPRGADGAEVDALPADEPTPEFAAQVAEEFRRLLDVLPDPALRELAVWKMEGHTTEEIATKWGCVPRTVERRLKVIRSLWAGEAVR